MHLFTWFVSTHISYIPLSFLTTAPDSVDGPASHYRFTEHCTGRERGPVETSRQSLTTMLNEDGLETVSCEPYRVAWLLQSSADSGKLCSAVPPSYRFGIRLPKTSFGSACSHAFRIAPF